MRTRYPRKSLEALVNYANIAVAASNATAMV